VELRRYLAILRRRIVLIVLTVAAAAGAAWVSTPQGPAYTSEATLYVGSRQLLGTGQGLSNDSLLAVERVIQTFAQMIDSTPVAEAALDRTNLPRSAGSVVDATVAAPLPGTQLLRIQVTDASPATAQQLANAMADAFIERVQTLEPTVPAGEGTIPALPAYVFQRAKVPTQPNPLGLTRRLFLGSMFGLVAACGIAFLLEYLDISVKTPVEAERRLELPVLGVIPLQRQTSPFERVRV
jgi:capsular polysaccharide biosynthesis protein